MQVMLRLALLLLTTLTATITACAHAPKTAPVSLRAETVPEDKAQLTFELLYEPKGNRKVELVLKLSVTGLEETNKLVAETYTRHFNVESGNTRWDGFVPPRQPQTIRLLLAIPEAQERASATVNLNRSHDSYPLMREELTFVVDADGMVRKE